ncbi:MAG TPA: SDR family NAD(P)-dependent oxidoreductase [Stellaceae bacterium]|nr:SDR family NAD(P)-dependent oxidoreductase [Stellaceae bacterium]
MEPQDFAGQVAVVTGAARGLGQALAALLAGRGARVFMVDCDGEGVLLAADAVAAQGGRVHAVAADVTSESALADLRRTIVVEAEGRLDILVNNAGGWRYGSLAEITLADWDWTFDVNVKSVFLATRALMTLMIERRYGRIVNIASSDAYRPKTKLPHYAAAKAAVVSLTKSIAEELAPHNVLVNAVSPGAIATETAKRQGWLQDRIPLIPVRRAAEPEDIAEVVLFLASPRNRFVVGECVLANGGMLMI